jgi:transcriptional regulator with XRE-family HTH domain
MDWKRRVGANMLRLRTERGWSQQALAGDANLSLRYLAGVERGEENPSLETLIAIADALAVSPASLFA